MSRDAKLIVFSNAARRLGYGILDVILVLYFTRMGLSPFQIGIFLTSTLFGSAILNLLFAMLADRMGRRRLMVLGTLLMIGSGAVLTRSGNFTAFLIAAGTGTLNFSSVSTSGFVAIDQSLLPQITSARLQNRIFGVYNTIGLLSQMAGALISVTPSVFNKTIGLDFISGYRLLLGVFTFLGLISLVCVAYLSKAVELTQSKIKPTRRILLLKRSRRTILRLSALFSVDALTSGLVASSLIVLWFHKQFGIGADVMGPIFAVSHLFQAASYPVAMYIADRVGLLRTMVFSHMSSQLFLISLPFAPNLMTAIVFLLSRQGLAHMDIPTRQAFIAMIVDPDERTASAGVTNLTRNITQSITPAFTGYAFQALSYGIPFILGGFLGIVYDISLYLSFQEFTPYEKKTRSF
jgi:MFS family permease